MMAGIVAVHCGAGNHSSKYYKDYNRCCKVACRKAVGALKRGGSALDAVTEAVVALEDSPLTNAGRGSNLTMKGFVETDASIMDGKTLIYGGCGAIKRVKNPIRLAYDLCVKQNEPLPLSLTPPSLLVGAGGLEYAKDIGLNIVSNKELTTPNAIRQLKKYKHMYELHQQEHEKMDTVGAICIDNTGHVAAACSSGGILLKKPGRVGQAALFGSGVWADSFESNGQSTAVCTSGCGEHLTQTLLAKRIGEYIKCSKSPTQDLHRVMTDDFLNSRFLKRVPTKLGGALVLQNLNGEVSVLWAHTTETMGVGYMTTNDSKAKSLMSVLPEGVQGGDVVSVGGACFFIEDKID